MRLGTRHGIAGLMGVATLLCSACSDDPTPAWDGGSTVGPPTSSSPGLGTGSSTAAGPDTGSTTSVGTTGGTIPTTGSATGNTLGVSTGTSSSTTGTTNGGTTVLTTGGATGVTSSATAGASTGQATGATSGAADAGTSGMDGTDTGSDAGLDAQADTDGSTASDAGPDSEAPVKPQELWKFVGNITTRGQVRSDFVDYWDQITPENEGKWESVERTRDQMNWSGLDAAYDYAMEHGLPFKQHTFVWGSQEPGWVASLSPQEQREEVEEWIRLYCERYPDTQMIDVVNEPPPHKTPSYMNAIGGAGASGWDWIVQSFRWARQYCPDAILILNDYNTIEYANDNAHFIDITRRALAAGAPIDAVGAQAHDAHKHSTDHVRGLLDKLARETGLPVYVSEYDISQADDETQRRIMASQFEMFWRNDNVAGITLWGYVEGTTWLPNTGLISPSGQARPAMTWLMDFLAQERR